MRCADDAEDEVLLKFKAVNGLNRPSNRDHRSVLSWFAAKRPLVAEEAEYIQRKEDLVSIHTGRECGGFDGLVETCLSFIDRTLTKRNCHIIKAGRSLEQWAHRILISLAENLLVT